MAWVAEENFNSLADGDLNTQGGGSGWSAAWTGDTDFDIQGVTLPSWDATGKAVKAVNPAAAKTIDRVLTTPVGTADNFYITMRADTLPANKEGGVWLMNGASTVCYVHFTQATGNIILYDGTAYRNVYVGFSYSTFYVINIEFSAATDQYRVRVYDGNWQAWSSWYSTVTAFDTIDRVRLNIETGGTMYWDTISASDPTVVPITQSLTEVLLLVDPVQTITQVLKQTLTNILSLVDSLSFKNIFNKYLTDTINFIDSLSSKIDFKKYIISVISFIENLTFSDIFNVYITETLTFVENVVRKTIYHKALTEILTFVDSISNVAKLFKSIIDSMSLSDILSIPGTWWKFLTKNIASWSNQAKNTAIWSHQSKNSANWNWQNKTDEGKGN